METTEIIDTAEQARVRREKLVKLQREGRDPFHQTVFNQTHQSGEIIDGFEKLDGKPVAIAGRIILKRIMGKASFVHILDRVGKIQFYISTNDVGADVYAAFCDMDLGDIVGVNGTVFKTKTGEVSVHATSIVLLSKALTPLPDKHAGLRDPEMRYRDRHVDLIANPEVRDIFRTRSRVVTAIREFFDARDYLEVETPVLQNQAGGANARPFITHHNSLDMKMFLRIAVELHHKRLIVGGFDRVYEIGRVFRNEGISYKHNPEFTMLEYYQAYADRAVMIEVFRELIQHCTQRVKGTLKFEYQGVKLDLSGKWKRMTMIDAVRDVTGLDFSKLDVTAATAGMKKLGLEFPRSITWGTLLYATFEQCVEKTLIQPTFIIGYPVEIAPLVKRDKNDPRLADMAELFIMGREMGNTYTEINDPIDQRERFMAQSAERAKGDDEAMQVDEEFLSALAYGMPPCGGQGLGVDRLVMLLAGTDSIRESLLFPTMRNK
ncbi:MAG: lysine--tRNA ligase [Firmicutes bacterium]|nr:lysine--tRNA ligase [Bacillota bacterium]